LSKPIGVKEKLIALAKKALLKKISYFLLFMKNTSGYQRYYGISPEKSVYVPFKVNNYPDILQIQTADHGYVFTGGISKRDYDTFFKAVDGLDCEIKVLVPPNDIAKKHGTEIHYEQVPRNVKIIHDDGSTDSWMDHIAKSKFVVLPTQKETISPTGVSTYLVAMALKKCVIITKCPATEDILATDSAVIVEPEDHVALKEAIQRINANENDRKTIAENGYRYAVSLEGHQRLMDDIVNFIIHIA
jgi:glycosyltransferase involved in cell wall biosynthesis